MSSIERQRLENDKQQKKIKNKVVCRRSVVRRVVSDVEPTGCIRPSSSSSAIASPMTASSSASRSVRISSTSQKPRRKAVVVSFTSGTAGHCTACRSGAGPRETAAAASTTRRCSMSAWLLRHSSSRASARNRSWPAVTKLLSLYRREAMVWIWVLGRCRGEGEHHYKTYTIREKNVKKGDKRTRTPSTASPLGSLRGGEERGSDTCGSKHAISLACGTLCVRRANVRWTGMPHDSIEQERPSPRRLRAEWGKKKCGIECNRVAACAAVDTKGEGLVR